MRKKKTLSLRVSAEFKKKLVEEAKIEKRSVTSYIEVTLGKLWEEKAGRIKEPGVDVNSCPARKA